ncbi:hypothetical protein SG34_014640 [Thalassomonas viridans]|uniref:Uncharacterized protein n=1 Tax=Thalassomonas viridans TaxID=137584 RepID=A0AAE9Z852_9GAMM|nr:hypothetical protein [Thalassomonas viridans]WDE08017.1 hypothetical protein SG34_014640 [Thalassomonas viridans]
MKDNRENFVSGTGPGDAEREISDLYRQIAKEQPSAELDNSILHLARNKELLTAKPEVKPQSLMEKIKSRSGPLAMAASVVLVGSVVLLQDWRQELLPKRYDPQPGISYDAPQTEPAQASQAVQEENAALQQAEVYQAAGQEQEAAGKDTLSQSGALTLDERPLKSQPQSRQQTRLRAQPELESLLPADDTRVDKARFKTEFAGADRDGGAKVPEVQAYPAPKQVSGATEATRRPAASQDMKKDIGRQESQQQAVKTSAMHFSRQGAVKSRQKGVTTWLAEIEQLLAAGEQEEAISELKAFVVAYPDHDLTEKYQKLLPQSPEN